MEIVSIKHKKTSEEKAKDLAEGYRMIYAALRTAGFSDDQAFKLLQDIIYNALPDTSEL